MFTCSLFTVNGTSDIKNEGVRHSDKERQTDKKGRERETNNVRNVAKIF